MSTYICIDLKSFYASVECVERGVDPLTTNLVVADKSRTDKTICLAVSPSLKSYGLGGRARLFEVKQVVKEFNAKKLRDNKLTTFKSESFFNEDVVNNKDVGLDFIVATPRMAYYMEYSSKIYSIYLKYVSEDDIHVYSIDEVFIDVTHYLKTYKLTARELALKMIKDVLKETGVTATCGIGTNLYLAKIAMDIVAKKMDADADGVRIAELDEMSYRKELWDHKPLTDFWRIGKGISNRLNHLGIYTQGDLARFAIKNEDALYKEFGVNAELIIDHAFGYEPCTIKTIKSYKPVGKSLSSGQVLKEPYVYDKAELIVKEMTDNLVLDLVENDLIADQMVLTVVYDNNIPDSYEGDIALDPYGRKMPKPAHGSINLPSYTNSISIINEHVLKLFKRIVDKKLKVRRIYVVANHLLYEDEYEEENKTVQLDLFTNFEDEVKKEKKQKKKLAKEKDMQKAIIKIKNKFGKNAVLKGNNLEEGATSIERNQSIGGHKA